MKVKICGITREEDALAAACAGADYVGFVFVRTSKRWVEPAKARSIISRLPSSVAPVGVFADRSREEIAEIARDTGIRVIQLHGTESPQDAEGLGLPVWKAFRVGPAFDPASMAAFRTEAYLLDTYVKEEPGGTGRTFDWNVAVAAKQYGPIILSGGLTPENAAQAVREVAPVAIDLSSGVESEPGVKDSAKIVRLFEALNFCRKKVPLC